MRYTNSFTIAMHRLAEAMNWRVTSVGSTWRIEFMPQDLGHIRDASFEGLTYSALALFSFMVRVANSSIAVQGLGWTFDTIRDKTRLRLGRTLQGDLMLPRTAAASDEATIYRLMKGAEDDGEND